jgi:hypothetical protein
LNETPEPTPESIEDESSEEPAPRDMLEDPIDRWTINHWRRALIGKEFDDVDENDDEMKRWQITAVEYKHKSGGFKSSYLVHYKQNDTGEEENTFLPWLFSIEKYGEVRKEEWFKEEFKNLADPKYRDETYEETFRVRDIVKAWWWKNKQHDKAYKAKIEKVNKNGTYDIVYEKDRKRETGVRPKYITKY